MATTNGGGGQRLNLRVGDDLARRIAALAIKQRLPRATVARILLEDALHVPHVTATQRKSSRAA